MKYPTWPCGLRKSINNAFTAHLDGTPSVFAADRTCAVWKDGKTRGQYINSHINKSAGTIKGLSKAAAILADRHNGVYSKSYPKASV